jgi:hypothetical protein
MKYSIYADDTTPYICYNPTDVLSYSEVIEKVNHCITDIKRWMSKNWLCLNDDKTHFTVFHRSTTTKSNTSLILPSSINCGSEIIKKSTSIKFLGVTLDDNLSFRKFIQTTCKNANYYIRQINYIRPYLTTEVTTLLVNSLILSRIDYCNSLLTNLPNASIHKLQVIINSAARVITRCKKRSHISPVLEKLKWLPIEKRIQHKILTTVFKCISNNKYPSYLSELLSNYQPTKNLRSEYQMLLNIPNANLKTVGQRSFSYQGPHLWNKLPLQIKCSKSVNIFNDKTKNYLLYNNLL